MQQGTVRSRSWRMTLRRIFSAIIFIGVAASVGLGLAFFVIDVPSIESFREREVPESTKIYDRTGEILLWEIHGEEKRTNVPLVSISRHVKNATIALEDDNFYKHRGVSPLAILRALVVDVTTGSFSQGGSTITQQLVKNALLDSDRSITRKIKEAILAVKLERAYTKDEILELYLNEIPYGSNAYGVEAASQAFFGKSSANLSLAESTYLAALPQAPSYYSPYGNHRKELDDRKNFGLRRMEELGFITQKERADAAAEEIAFRPPPRGGIIAPHFVMYVRDALAQRFDEYAVERAGLKIITSLDVKAQGRAEEVVAKYGETNHVEFGASNAGMIVLDPTSGDILAMVGSRDYFNTQREGNFNVTLAHRQPGSAFKPVVYATALARGYTPETVVFDLATNFAVPGAEPYAPQNYDGKYRGPVTFRSAVAQSLNVPSVKVLYLAGLSETLAMAQRMGITSLTDPDRYGLSLVLGGGEVSLLELSSAYGTFAADGLRAPSRAILKIEDKNGNVLFEDHALPERVIDAEVARNISSMLSDNDARAPIFGASSPMYFRDVDVAVKTGTTNDFRDAWIVGYNPSVVVGVWAGNNDNSPMDKKVAGYVVAPAWRAYMNYALSELVRPGTFIDPSPTPKDIKPVLRGEWRGSRTYTIDAVSKKLATEYTPPELREERVLKEAHEILRWVDRADPRGSIPERPFEDSQFAQWEGPVRAWAAANGFSDESASVIPTETDTVHTPDASPVVSLVRPIGGPFSSNAVVAAELSITAKRPIARVDIFLNEEFIRSERASFQKISFSLSSAGVLGAENTLTFRAYDDVGNRGELSVAIGIVF